MPVIAWLNVNVNQSWVQVGEIKVLGFHFGIELDIHNTKLIDIDNFCFAYKIGLWNLRNFNHFRLNINLVYNGHNHRQCPVGFIIHLIE